MNDSMTAMYVKRIMQEQADSAASADHFFLLVMGIIIFLMQAGFAFLEAGSVRAKNTTNILIKNFLDACFGCLAYWSIGWALAYGDLDATNPAAGFIGFRQFFLADLSSADYSTWFFQFTFAATTATITSGAMAERADFRAYLIYTIVNNSIVYPIVSHWFWSPSGWLAAAGVQDFAGSTVVHTVGGLSALVGAIFLRPRIGKFVPIDQADDVENGKAIPSTTDFPRIFVDRHKYKARTIGGHSTVMATLGAFILFLGFLAFNGGSELAISTSYKYEDDGITIKSSTNHAEAVSLIVCNTIIAGAVGGVVGLILGKFVKRDAKWSLMTTINGCLAGMVAICSGVNVFYPSQAFAVGIIGACFYYLVAHVVENVLLIDDPVECIAVHFGGGFIGTLCTVLFGNKSSLFVHGFTAEVGASIGIQLAAIITVSLWTIGLMGITFYLCAQFGILRVPAEMEVNGLDFCKHGELGWELQRKSEGNIFSNPSHPAPRLPSQ